MVGRRGGAGLHAKAPASAFTRIFHRRPLAVHPQPRRRRGPEGHVWFEGRGWRVPDVTYWRADKPQCDADRSLPPTLAIEIVSRRQALPGLRRKCREMLSLGVDVCWLIDPERRRAEVFDDERDGVQVPPDGFLETSLIPGLRVSLAELWEAASS